MEAVAITAKVGTIDDVIQHLWMSIEDWVYETDRSLAMYGSFLIKLQEKFWSVVFK